MTRRHVAVIGCGPAGLQAAVAAIDAGARVTLIDSSDSLGGQFWRHLPPERSGRREALLHHHWDTYQQLRDVLVGSADCEIRCELQIWTVEYDSSSCPVLVGSEGPVDSRGRTIVRVRADAIVFATGAHDRTLPFPGWTLPGVYTAGAAQAFAKGERIAVGNRALIAGAGPFLLPVAASLVATGAQVIGVCEANPMRNLVGWVADKPWQLAGAVGKVGELAGYVGTHVRHRIPYRTGTAVVAAHGANHVESVTTARVDRHWRPIAGTQRRYDVDAVCVSHGFTPRIELPIAAGCEITAERFVRVNDTQQTSIDNVYAAGEITSIGGCDAALAEGAIAGHCAAGGNLGDAETSSSVRRRRTFSHFASRLDAAHRIRSGWTDWLTGETLLCRCEETRAATFADTVGVTETASLRSVKLTTRAGLGICQGRICGRNVEEYLDQLAPDIRADGVSTDRRPIAVPVRLGDLAGCDVSSNH